jgi:hypothetical protein
MEKLHEEQKHAVVAAAQRERAAWTALERVSRPNVEDESALQAYRERWRAAAHSLVEALQALKS